MCTHDAHTISPASVCWMRSSTQLDYNKRVFIAMPTQRRTMRWCMHYVALAHKCVMFSSLFPSLCFLSAINQTRKFILHSVGYLVRVCDVSVCVCFFSFLLLILRIQLGLTFYTEKKCMHIHRHISVSISYPQQPNSLCSCTVSWITWNRLMTATIRDTCRIKSEFKRDGKHFA